MTATTLAGKLDALLGAGQTYKAIAAKADCDTSTIFRIRSGAISNPSYSVGKAIDEMFTSLRKSSNKKTAA